MLIGALTDGQRRALALAKLPFTMANTLILLPCQNSLYNICTLSLVTRICSLPCFFLPYFFANCIIVVWILPPGVGVNATRLEGDKERSHPLQSTYPFEALDHSVSILHLIRNIPKDSTEEKGRDERREERRKTRERAGIALHTPRSHNLPGPNIEKVTYAWHTWLQRAWIFEG